MRKNGENNNGNFLITAKDKETLLLLSNLRENKKQYNKIHVALSLLGKFSDRVVAEVFEVSQETGRIDLVVSDDNSDLFIFTVATNSKKDLNIIQKISNSEELFYDLSLLKKSEITEENINLCKTFKTYDTKYGRFITDYHTFFTLFLGKNVCYQLQADFRGKIDTDLILKQINECDDVPTFMDFIKAFERILLPEYIDDIKEASCYDNFCQIQKIVMSPTTSDDKIYLIK